MDTSDPKLWWRLNGGKITSAASKRHFQPPKTPHQIDGPPKPKSPPSMEQLGAVRPSTSRPINSTYMTQSRRSTKSASTAKLLHPWIEFLMPYWLSMGLLLSMIFILIDTSGRSPSEECVAELIGVCIAGVLLLILTRQEINSGGGVVKRLFPRQSMTSGGKHGRLKDG